MNSNLRITSLAALVAAAALALGACDSGNDSTATPPPSNSGTPSTTPGGADSGTQPMPGAAGGEPAPGGTTTAPMPDRAASPPAGSAVPPSPSASPAS